MKKGIFSVMGQSQPALYATLASYSQSFHMPYINLNFPSAGDHQQPLTTPAAKPHSPANVAHFQLNLRPSHGRALVDLVRHYGWTNLVYLYDSEEGELISSILIRVLIDRVCPLNRQ